MEAIMAVYPRHKAVVDTFIARGEVVGPDQVLRHSRMGRPDDCINASASPDNGSVGKPSSGCALGPGNPSDFWALAMPALAILSALRIRRRRR
jgi:MYXO-CTERM domain-containing protein